MGTKSCGNIDTIAVMINRRLHEYRATAPSARQDSVGVRFKATPIRDTIRLLLTSETFVLYEDIYADKTNTNLSTYVANNKNKYKGNLLIYE